MKIFRHLFWGLVLVLMTFSSLTFVQAAECDGSPEQTTFCHVYLSASGWIEDDNSDAISGVKVYVPGPNKSATTNSSGEFTVSFRHYPFRTNGDGTSEGENRVLFEKDGYKKKKVMISYTNLSQSSDIDMGSIEIIKDSATTSLENNKDYQASLKLVNEAQTMAASDCGSKIETVTSGARTIEANLNSSKESFINGFNTNDALPSIKANYKEIKTAYDEECIKTTTSATEDGDPKGETLNPDENEEEQETPPATQAGADRAFSAYQKEIAKAEEWMTSTEGRRNYIPTKELRDEINPILENASTAILAEDWKTATFNYNEATNKVLSANAQFRDREYLELSDKNFDSILVDNKIIHIGGNFEGKNEERLGKTFFTKILPMINRLVGVLGILYLLILGVKFILAQGEDEKMSQYKDQAVWLIVGLGLVSVAEFVGFDIFDPNQKDVLSDASAKPFYDKLMQIVRFFEYIAMGLVLVNGIISGYKLITSGEEEETVSQEKKFLKSFIIGTIFILMAEVIVRVLAYQDENLQTTQDILIQEVSGIINFILTFIGGVAMLMLIVSGIYYVTSFGDEDQMGRAKRMILTSIGGIAIAFSAYTIAQFLVNH